MKRLSISVRQPWAELIVAGLKTIENRSWKIHYRGTIAVHASSTNTKREYEAASQLIRSRGMDIQLPPLEQLELSGIVGLVDVVDCLEHTEDPWWIPGNYAIVLANARRGIFQPMKGQQGFFTVDYKYFGSCDRCGDAVLIPGLDASLCKSCGWVWNVA